MQTANIELAAGGNLRQLLIFFAEEIEAPGGTLVLGHGLRELAQFLHAGAGIGEGRDEL